MDNWSDEAQLRDVNHVRHHDGSREAVWVTMLLCGAGLVLVIQSGLSGFLFYLVGAVVLTAGVGVGLLVQRWIGGIARSEQDFLAAEQHEAGRLEREKQLAEFRARNAALKDPRTLPRQEVVE